MTSRTTYISYLLRLWSTEEGGQIRWRASLESPHGSGRVGFRSLERLFAFLEDQTMEEDGGVGSPEARTFKDKP